MNSTRISIVAMFILVGACADTPPPYDGPYTVPAPADDDAPGDFDAGPDGDDDPVPSEEDSSTVEPTDAGGGPSTNPMNPPGPRECSDTESQWLRDNISTLSSHGTPCAISCISSPDKTTCFTECLIERGVDDISRECLSCFGGQAECIFDGGCVDDCIGGPTSPGCVSCFCAAGCAAAYDECTGLSTSDDCN